MTIVKLTGAAVVALPLILLAWALLWRRERHVFWFALVLILVGTGYLMATGATDDLARRLVPRIADPPPARAR